MARHLLLLVACVCWSQELGQGITIANPPKVGFTAFLDRSLDVSSTLSTLVYKKVITNVGNAYNPQTGIFKAPVSGLYYFSFSGSTWATSNLCQALYKNGGQVTMLFSNARGGQFVTVSNAVTLQLNTGDEVYMIIRENSSAFDNHNNHNTFSGYLLYPL